MKLGARQSARCVPRPSDTRSRHCGPRSSPAHAIAGQRRRSIGSVPPPYPSQQPDGHHFPPCSGRAASGHAAAAPASSVMNSRRLTRSPRRRGRASAWEFRGQAPNVTLTVVGDLRSSNGEAMSAIFRNHRDEGPIPGSREIKDRRKRLNAIFDATSDAG